MRQFPRLLVIATSRPYGKGQPSHSEGFTPLDIQPLSDNDIQELARRFFTFCYGKEQEPATHRAARFWTAVQGSHAALQLARTPLLLTMMLFISRSRPLPDKRHQLYQACIENLLSALPKQKEEEGALHPRHYWRPDDAEERMRVTAELATALHRRRGQEGPGAIIATLDELERLLPSSWPQAPSSGMSRSAMRRGFIHWLAGPAGLLSERADGALSFAHLSIQEFLVAWHLNATVEGQERLATFTNQAGALGWAEILRLWAALLAAQSDERLNAVLDALAREQGERGLELLGTLFADGLGPSTAFEPWLASLTQRLSEQFPWGITHWDLWDVWANSRQEERRARLIDTLREVSPRLSLPRQLVLRTATTSLIRLWTPTKPTLASAALTWLDAPNNEVTARSVAAGRVFSLLGAWPVGHEQLELLQAWPSLRRIIGIRHQLAILCGVRKGILARGLRGTLERYKADQRLPRSIMLSRIEVVPAPGDVVPYPFLKRAAASFGSPPWSTLQIARGQSVASLDFEFVKEKEGHPIFLHHVFIHLPEFRKSSLLEAAARMTSYHRGTYGGRPPYGALKTVATQWGIKEGKSWLEDYAHWDSLSLGLHITKHLIATRHYQSSEGQLLSTACKESLSPDQFAGATAQALSNYPAEGDPLWPALARQLIRSATAQDRAVLEEAVRDPDKRAAPLSWGLRYIVRGDLMLDDGTEVQLDELSREEGLELLPVLEEAPASPELSYEDARQFFASLSQLQPLPITEK